MTITEPKRGAQGVCSAVSLEAGESPLGTAPSYFAYVMIESPTPWRQEVSESIHFPAAWREVLDRLTARLPGVRFQGVLPQVDATPDRVHVLIFRRGSGAVAQFERTEYRIPPDQVPALLTACFEPPGEPAAFEGYREISQAQRDIFVCTHGVRDTCCGRLGYPIFEVLRRQFERDPTIRVWRSSHLGGHRFAPTLLDMPEGRYWGRVEPAALDAIVARQGPVASVRPYLRGWAVMDSAVLQVAEAAVFMAEGWRWLEMQRTAQVTAHAKDSVQVQVTGLDADNRRKVWEATVAHAGQIHTLVSCGAGPVEAIDQFEVTRLVPA